MSYKTDFIIDLLGQILDRLEQIEEHLGIEPKDTDLDGGVGVRKVFRKKVDKPSLSVVQSTQEDDNVIQFSTDE